MISALSLARSYTARLALGVLQNDNNSTSSSESNSPASRLLNSLGLSDSSSTRLDSKTLSVLLQAIQNQNSSAAGGDKTSQAVAGTIGSKSFMTTLKDRLSNTGSDPMSYVNNQAMLGALRDGTLKVTNPATGETATAYDPADGKKHSTATEASDPKAWNKFLQDHLKRNDDGSFAKSADGSYIDAKTGENAYFDKIGGSYYYFTWPGKMSANV